MTLCAVCATASAQDVTDAEMREQGSVAHLAMAGASGPRSSEFDPGTPTDTRFIVDVGPGLDTGCTFRGGGPLVFDVEVTRYVGPVNADGTLRDAAALVASGLLAPTARLAMPGFDVDSRAVVAGRNPEVDKVFFNGVEIGQLDGLNGRWIENSFTLPVSALRFPSQGAFGTAPTPARNRIEIHIDVANTTEVWCTSVDWAKLEIGAISPVILVHGNNSDAGFFDRQGFSAVLEAKRLPFDGCGGCRNPVNLPTTSVSNNGSTLLRQIPGLVRSFGTDSYHLVVHSKGGLDTRHFLASQGAQTPQAISYTSLSTPHNGSVGADILVARSSALQLASRVELESFPALAATVIGRLSIDGGTSNLRTGFTAGFNASNLPNLPSGTVFNAVAGDLDEDADGSLSLFPDEYNELRDEDLSLSALHLAPGGPLLTRFAVDAIYQTLRTVGEVSVSFREESRLIGAPRLIAVLTAVPVPGPLGNDALVTIPSGLGRGMFNRRVTNQHLFTGTAAKNHSSIAGGDVARVVIPWIIEAEALRGDLRGIGRLRAAR